MSDTWPEQPPGSPPEQPYFAPPPGYGPGPQPQQPYGVPPQYYHPGPIGKPHRTRNMILGIAGAVVLVAAIATVAELVVTSGKAAPAASATSPAGSLSVHTWYTSDVQPTVNKLYADLSRLSTDAANGKSSAALADCQQVLTAVQKAQSDPPVSDPTLARDWSTVLGDYAAGASDCVGGINNPGGSQLARARSEIEQGNTNAGKLAKAIEKVASGS